MALLLILLAIVLIAALAPVLGADSRRLDDGSWQRDGLWARRS
jgi:hypothetical protein